MNEKYLGFIEVNGNEFYIVRRGNFLVYGVGCNAGLLDCGKTNIQDYCNESEALQEFYEDILENENGGIPSGLFIKA